MPQKKDTFYQFEMGQNSVENESPDISVQSLSQISDFIEILNTVINEAYEGIIILDKNGYVLYTNKKHAEYLKLPQRVALHSHISEITHDESIAEGFMNVIRTGEPDLYRIIQAHGREFVANRIPIKKNGKVIGAAGLIIFDIRQVDLIHSKMILLENQLKYYKEQVNRLRSSKYSFEHIIGESDIMLQLKKEAKKAASLDGTILLLGESGTGKELFAHAIHNQSRRKDGPFIRVNCAAIPRELLESELFGYEPGTFTGANKKGKKGKFEYADTGTILLDEVGDMPLEMQSQLLRVLQEKEVERIGGSKPIKVDFRLIAATNRSLEDLIRKGMFRSDLFYRLNVVRLELPPLRSRAEDIRLLSEVFLTRLAKSIGVETLAVTSKALALLQSYQFPGNVRELYNVFERVVNKMDFERANDGTLAISEREIARALNMVMPEGASPLPFNSLNPESNKVGRVNSSEAPAASKRDLKSTRMEHEAEVIREALKECGGNLSSCAKMLGISRAGFHRKLKLYGLQADVLRARKHQLESLIDKS